MEAKLMDLGKRAFSSLTWSGPYIALTKWISVTFCSRVGLILWSDGLRLLFNTYSMKIHLLLYFEHKNDITIIVKLLYRATSCRLEAL